MASESQLSSEPVQAAQASRQNYQTLARHSLILCASLVHNPANVGGLCRLAEVFRLQSFVMSSLAIAQDPAFRKTAVSAHHWQPMDACLINELPGWFAQHRQNNYHIIGLDVHHGAGRIATFTFPTHSLLVLGQELTGIPEHLLKECDRLVTIPQYGLVESLNVQQAAAIAIYEYVKQHHLPRQQ